jgi:uncharacterized protein (UPF0335 family)
MSPRRFEWSAQARERVSQGIAWATLTLSLAVGVASISLQEPSRMRVEPTDVAYQAGQIDGLIMEIKRLRAEQSEVEKALKRSPDAGTRLLASQIERMEEKQTQIEQAIMASPEKALTLPLLRNDLNNLRDAQAQQISALKASIDQVYDLNKWLLGAMAIAIIGLALTRLLTSKAE